MEELRTVDAIAGAVLALALLRGAWIGAVREAFSLAGLAAAIWLVRHWSVPAGEWLVANGPFAITDLAARIVAALALGIGALAAASVLSRIVGRGVQGAGLGLVDRLAGALLGAAEGTIVVAALLFGLIALLGRDDEALVGTRSLAAYEWIEAAAGLETTRDGAARSAQSAGSTQPPRSRISATSRSGAACAATLRTTHSCPT